MKVNEELSLLVMLEKSKMTKPIIIRMTIEGQRREISLGIKVVEKYGISPQGALKEIARIPV